MKNGTLLFALLLLGIGSLVAAQSWGESSYDVSTSNSTATSSGTPASGTESSATTSEKGVVESVKDAVQAVKERVQEKLEIHQRVSGTAAVRG